MKPLSASAALCLALCAAAPPAAVAETPAQSRPKIEALIKAFGKAITDKDQEGFMRLFLRENISWVSVNKDATLAYYHAKFKDSARPVPKAMAATPRMFIERMAADPEPGTEIFENVRIDTDGDIAQVWFDYSFMEGDYRSNWGKEAWHLVRTDSGWKIASVVYSTEKNPEPPPKK